MRREPQTCGEPMACGDCGRLLWCCADTTKAVHQGGAHVTYCVSCESTTNMRHLRLSEDSEKARWEEKMLSAAREHEKDYIEAKR